MGLVVTGISQDGKIVTLEDKLRAAGLPLDPLQKIDPGDEARQLTDVVEEGHIDTDIMTGGSGQGTSVPGLTGSGSASLTGLGVGRHRYFHDESAADRLGDLEIPDSEVENYIEALDAGRSIVAYYAKTENVNQVEQVFRDSGLAKVKIF